MVICTIDSLHTKRCNTQHPQEAIHECAELCDSARKMLAEEFQELETEHKKLMKEEEDLNEKFKAH